MQRLQEEKMKLISLFLIAIVILSGCVQKTPVETCQLSLCDCKCHSGEIQEDKGLLCGINCLGEFGVAGCETRAGQCVEIYDRESQAQQKCRQLCMNTDEDLSSGPCLSDDNPSWNVSDWVCDVAHSPRQSVDNLVENQCSAYREGLAKHFVEVDTNCNLIKAV